MTKGTGIGRGARRPGAGRPRKKVSDLMAVNTTFATIRKLLEVQGIELTDLRRQRHDEMLLRRLTEIERTLKLTDLHRPARSTRRRPLGAD